MSALGEPEVPVVVVISGEHEAGVAASLGVFDAVFSYVFAVVCVFIALGNSFVIFAICHFERLRRNVSNYFIASLALADLITGCAVIPMGIYQKNLPLHSSIPLLFCDTFQTMHITCAAASILHLMAISLDRYYRIKEPLKYRSWMTPQKASALVCALWAASLVDGLCCLMAQKMAHIPYVSECEYLMGNPWVVMVLTVIFVFAPSVTLVMIYVKLYRLAVQYKAHFTESTINVKGVLEAGLRRHRGAIKNVKDLNVHGDDVAADGQAGSSGGQSSGPTKDKDQANGPSGVLIANRVGRSNSAIREHRAAVLIGIVLFAYITCMVPSISTYFIKSFCKDCQVANSKLFYLYPWLLWINSGMNPIIYLLLNNEFRKAFKRVFCRLHFNH